MHSLFARYARGLSKIPIIGKRSSTAPYIYIPNNVRNIECSIVTQSTLMIQSFTKRSNSSLPTKLMDEDDLHEQNTRAFTEIEKPSEMTSILIEVKDGVGVLCDILRFFWKYDINVRHIESRPAPKINALGDQRFCFYVDFEGVRGKNQNVEKLIIDLEDHTARLTLLDDKEVPWFPRRIEELDFIANNVLDAGTDLEADHPGFHDEIYRQRRAELGAIAQSYRWGKEIPIVNYSPDEIGTWGAVWDQMEDLLQKYACKEYKDSFQMMKDFCQYSRNNIPQQRDINTFLSKKTKFRLRPVSGLLSSRDFLNGLAFRVFFCTQYIRHHSMPLYTPEPDICHELLGHAPMFADSDFADFSQEIGLASLGASDEDIDKLARCYWYTVEFGLCKENENIKAYGAGLLSSFGELEYACSPNRPAGGVDDCPKLKAWDPHEASKLEFPITKYQPVYFVAESLQNAKEKMRKFCEQLHRPFFASFNENHQSIYVDRPVKRLEHDEK